MIHVLKGAGKNGLNFTIFSDSICSLKLLKEDIQSTNMLEFNTNIQLENFIVLSEQLPASRFSSMVNLADLLTTTLKDPINKMNLV